MAPRSTHALFAYSAASMTWSLLNDMYCQIPVMLSLEDSKHGFDLYAELGVISQATTIIVLVGFFLGTSYSFYEPQTVEAPSKRRFIVWSVPLVNAIGMWLLAGFWKKDFII